ncbi:17027_t:CDS:2 [Racocetra persica]|uniref:17027_t:CDS:1 n=1 Tax=Racocetra persica TaxID=160502 RepID=A0ACA9L5Y6_9GLOM|nr:17027_t:CDS:2 [Racocetra persica]
MSLSLDIKFFLLFLLIIQVTPLNTRTFLDDVGCEIVQYPPEILGPVPHLKECLSTINSLVVYPGDPNYYESIKTFNCRYSYFPVVIIYVTNILDIQLSIYCANTLKIPVTARSGGHSFEEYGNGGRNGVMVIDVKEFNQVSIDKETNTAIIGAGNRLIHIYRKLNQAGFLFPAGTCLLVGIGGYATGGGYGFVARKYGMSSDNVISAEMVTANGSFLSSINSTHHSDLFFALRGAGNAGYGIITSFTFKIYPIPPIVTAINISYVSEQVDLLFMSIAKVAKNLSDKLTPDIRILSENDRLYIGSFYGVFLGSAEEAKSAVNELIELTEPAFTKFVELSWEEAVEKSPRFERQPFKSTSYVIAPPGLSREGLKFLRNFINNIECTTKALFYLMGGAINKFSVNSSAFMHRDSLYMLQMAMHLEGHNKEVQDKCFEKHLQFSQEFRAKYAIYFSYQNYIDRNLQNWETRYYGHHFPRLVETKRKYDPNNLFNWAQSIPIKFS